VQHRLTRRKALEAGAAAIVAPALLARRAEAAAAPRIVVVGAGLAGMTAAYRIWKRRRWRPRVYEAHAEIGGRTKTIRGLAGGQHAERGGTFISSGDHAIRGLVHELGLSLVDTYPIYPDGAEIFYFGGRRRKRRAITDAEREVQKRSDAQFERIVWPPSYNRKNAATVAFDHMTAAEWIERYVPGGLGSVYGAYLKVYFETEYGGSVQHASSLAVIGSFSAPYPNYDERYLVRGGSDRVAHALGARLPRGTVRTGAPLRALRRRSGGTYACTFEVDGKLVDVAADVVVLALPFTGLRDVDYRGAGIQPRMRTAIEQLGMGEGSKLNLQFRRPVWQPRSSGDSLSDLVTGSTWAGQLGQQGAEGIMVCMNGTPFSLSYGSAPAHAKASSAVVAQTLAALGRVFPEIRKSFIPGQAYLDYWPVDPYIKGTYAYYRVGGFTTFGGIESRRQGNIVMAGEHTEPISRSGLMNGAVRSGERAAREVLA
jgi:monoamine oxidase